MNKKQLEQYWQAYLATLPDATLSVEICDASQFGDHSDLADKLGNLILKEIKTATCSALWEWEAEGSELPKVGSKTIVLDGNDSPLCIIETIDVVIRAFNEVDAKFAYEEGEDDRSLESWRAGHWKYFSRVLPKIFKKPDPEMLLVCEGFRVVYKEELLEY
jgi:uncharacterized protein YhfF